MEHVVQIKDGLVVNIIAVSRETKHETEQFLKKNGFQVFKDHSAEIGDEFDGKKIKKIKKIKKVKDK